MDFSTNLKIQIDNFFKQIPAGEKNELKKYHFFIIHDVIGFTKMYNLSLLQKLWHFRSKYQFRYADIQEVIKRNIGKKHSLKTEELLAIFEPEQSFYEQCLEISKRRETFFNRRKENNDFFKQIDTKKFDFEQKRNKLLTDFNKNQQNKQKNYIF